MKFIDEIKIFIKAGDGGDGCASFRREKFIARGGPNGGDGGDGGDIIFKCTKDLNNLLDFKFKQYFKAQNGENGKKNNKQGVGGKNLIIKVPVGTEVLDVDQNFLLADLTQDEEEISLLQGGKGGHGNTRFKTSTNRSPRKYTHGVKGEEMWIILKLKLLSNIGLVGLPNAGKSTFLSLTTNAKAKIGSYPFTTLKPKLGIIKYQNKKFTLADIPGLIEGASKGKGLGDKFLKHIERCEILIHLIDITSDDILLDYFLIRKELESYSKKLKLKKEIIALNKIDLITKKEKQQKILQIKSKTNKEIFSISTLNNENIEQILSNLVDLYSKHQHMGPV